MAVLDSQEAIVSRGTDTEQYFTGTTHQSLSNQERIKDEVVAFLAR